MIGTGAISHKHAQAYKNIGFELTVCTDIIEAGGRRFAEQYGARIRHDLRRGVPAPDVDYVDVCTFPDFRLQPIEPAPKARQTHSGAETDLDQPRDRAQDDRDGAQGRHHVGRGQPAPLRRFQFFLAKAIAGGPARQTAASDCYVKWYRSPAVLLAADQGKLGDRRRRRADQPGDSPVSISCAGWPAR